MSTPASHEGSVDEAKFKFTNLLELQALRLLRAFFRIGDAKRREELVLCAEELASSSPDAFPPPNGADR
jgi:hypothetical protein